MLGVEAPDPRLMQLRRLTQELLSGQRLAGIRATWLHVVFRTRYPAARPRARRPRTRDTSQAPACQRCATKIERRPKLSTYRFREYSFGAPPGWADHQPTQLVVREADPEAPCARPRHHAGILQAGSPTADAAGSAGVRGIAMATSRQRRRPAAR